MEIKHLQTFRTIVSEGSFTKAAEKLNYTQSTITFQIGQLENELSTKLFEKIGRRMLLTKAGEQLIPYIDDVVASVDKMRCFETDLTEYQGDLRIGVGETLLCYQLPEVLKEFHKQAPKARLHLRSMNCCDIRDELLNGTVDLGIFYEDVGGFGSNLITHPFGCYPVTLVASQDTKRKYPDFITPDQNMSVPFVTDEPACIFRRMFEEYLQKKSISLEYAIELWSIATIKNLVKSNMGVSFLPRFTVEEELQRGELAEIQTDITDTCISAVCAHHKNKWISPAMELFIRLISPKDSLFVEI